MINHTYKKTKLTRKQKEKRVKALNEQRLRDQAQIKSYKKFFTGKASDELYSYTDKKETTMDINSHRLASNLPSKEEQSGVASKKDRMIYTGSKLIGIGSLHKSNLVPVFQADDCVDLSHMRR